MSTPSPQPLDYDLISPYAPKHVREQPNPAFVAESEPAAPQKPRPVAIETEHDAKILDDIEDSLRAMIAAHHTNQEPEAADEQASSERADRELPAEAASDLGKESSSVPPQEALEDSAQDEPPARTIDVLDAPSLAQDRYSPEHRLYETMRVQEVLKQVAQQVAQHSARDAAHEPPRDEPELRIEGYRVPPAFLAPSMEPIQFDEPWPKARPRRRNGSANLLLRFGLAAGGAAAVALFALPDMRSRLYNTVSVPLAGLSSNAATVFGEGKPVLARDEPMTTIAVRTQPIVVAREQNGSSAPIQKLAVAGTAPALPAFPDQRGAAPDQRGAAKNDNNPPPARIPEAQPQREAVMAPVAPVASVPPATVEPPNRVQSLPRNGAPGRPAANENATSGVAARPLAAEEIELLRKQGNEFISAGDFAGARGVLERAADAGDAASALALAATYDPAVLARFKVKGLMPDNAKAAHWYERARDLGSQEAPLRLNALARGS